MGDGLAPDVKVIAEGMIRGAMGLVTDVMRGARDTAIALSHERDRQRGMAGDDDAGRDFAKVYRSAASATLDQLGFSSYVLGESGRGLMRNAREFMAQESSTVAAVIGRQVDLTVGMGDPNEGCTENYLGLGDELPEVVGKTGWFDKYVEPGGGDRFRFAGEAARCRRLLAAHRETGADGTRRCPGLRIDGGQGALGRGRGLIPCVFRALRGRLFPTGAGPAG